MLNREESCLEKEILREAGMNSQVKFELEGFLLTIVALAIFVGILWLIAG
jgi:hypothetical protein